MAVRHREVKEERRTGRGCKGKRHRKIFPQRRASEGSGAANVAYRCDPSRENGLPERPQTLRESEIIEILSAELAQSEAERN